MRNGEHVKAIKFKGLHKKRNFVGTKFGHNFIACNYNLVKTKPRSEARRKARNAKIF